MSLLDDVSIVVTPNGYKAGELYAVIPVPTEGADEIVNGDFAYGSDWSLWDGGTIISNEMVLNCGTTTNAYTYQSKATAYTLGRRFQITIEIISNTTGTPLVLYPFSNSPNTSTISIGTVAGIYKINFTSDYSSGTGTTFALRALSSTGTLVIDNVSVKEYTSADMDVTRETAATRVDENGLVNYAEILGGEEVTCGDFSCAVPTDYWTATHAVISFDNNQLTVDDTAGAGGDSRGSQAITTESGKTYRLTFNRISTTSYFYLGVGNGTSYTTFFYSNLGTDTGEYTLEFTATSSSSTIAFISGGNGITVFSNISVKQVDRDNVPRIDYTGGGCPHILAEPQRTNTTTRSNELDLWGAKSNVTITPDYSLSPDGSINSNRLLFSANGFTHNNLTQVISTIYSISVYAKRNSGTENVGFFVNGSGAVNYAFNLTNEWQRFEYTYTSTNTSTFGIAGLSGADVSIFGFQSEVASYATSYIPTNGEAGGVTRNQDIFTRDGIGSLINSTEGVLFVEMAALSNDGSYRVMTISDGTTANYIALYYSPTTNNISWELKVGNAVQFSRSVSLPLGSTSFNKFAFKYKENDCKLFLNGVESDIYTSNVTFTSNTLNSLFLTNGDGILHLFGKVKQLQVYNTALTDEQLLQLTGESGTDFYESYAEMASALTYTIQ